MRATKTVHPEIRLWAATWVAAAGTGPAVLPVKLSGDDQQQGTKKQSFAGVPGPAVPHLADTFGAFPTQYNVCLVRMNKSPCDTAISDLVRSSPSSPIAMVFSNLNSSPAATTNTSPRKF